MKRYLWLWIFLLGITGCALPIRTQGVVGPVTWATTAFDLHSSNSLDGPTDRYSFTLTLHETQGLALTFTKITWEVWQNGVDLSGRQMRTGSWQLPANGTLRQPFVYRIICHPSFDCPNVGPTSQWDIVFEGHDPQDRAVRVAVQAELPWIPPNTVDTPPNSQQEPSVELKPIDFTVPRLYFPTVGRD